MDFYKRLQYVCSQIPYGRAATYGQLALLCGRPNNSRQVGFALRTGRMGDSVPAHRIVNSRGFLTGAPAFSYPEEQKLLLQSEGISVCDTPKGRQVDLSRYGWRPSLEEAERFRCYFEKEQI